eukprot:COSAG02_NODE_31013_length_540_cov_89.430839_2_plen_37_part_01
MCLSPEWDGAGRRRESERGSFLDFGSWSISEIAIEND